MARQLHRAAKAAGDNAVTSASILTTYVRRWEAGKTTPTERYQLHYCRALDIPPTDFGLGMPLYEPGRMEPTTQPGSSARYLIAVIPYDCRRIVIDITGVADISGAQLTGRTQFRSSEGMGSRPPGYQYCIRAATPPAISVCLFVFAVTMIAVAPY
jgi:hypothetical protein